MGRRVDGVTASILVSCRGRGRRRLVSLRRTWRRHFPASSPGSLPGLSRGGVVTGPPRSEGPRPVLLQSSPSDRLTFLGPTSVLWT